jgi:hypothetical protein
MHVIDEQYPKEWDFLLLTIGGSGRILKRPELYPAEVAAIAGIRESTCLVKDVPGILEMPLDCSYRLAN